MQEHQPDSSTSSSKARGKGKSKEEDYDETGNPKNKSKKIVVTDRQKNVINESKSELQATDLLKKVEELQKEVGDMAKMLSESGISLATGSKQAHGRSGVDSAGKTSKRETGKPAPSGGSGSREPTHVRYRGMHGGKHRAGIWGHAPGYGSFLQGHKDGKT